MKIERIMPSISFIVARSKPGNIIGCENKLPWRLSDDLKRFKAITSGHAVIMGSKTYDSIGRALPNRNNIVISRKSKPNLESISSGSNTTLDFCSSIEQAMYVADFYSIKRNVNEFFVIGGAEIYRSFISLFNKIYLTEVLSGEIVGDAYFVEKFDKRKWKTESEIFFPADDNNEFPTVLSIIERKRKHVRQRDISEFLTRTLHVETFKATSDIRPEPDRCAVRPTQVALAI